MRHPLVSSRARLAHDDGSILIFVAVTMLALVLFASFVLDLGNAWVHKRHLQTQADATALATASALSYPCDAAAAEADGLQYSGEAGAPYNQQVGNWDRGDIAILFNSTQYEEPSWPESPWPPPDDTPLGDPCRTGVVDVKATEGAHVAVPMFFSGLQSMFGIQPLLINAHARAAVRRVGEMKDFLPLAVEDPEPKHVFVQFVRADTGASPGTCGAANPDCIFWLEQPDPMQPIWTIPADLSIPASVSVTVGLVYSQDLPTAPDYCPLDSASVQCYRGVNYIRGWSSGAAPSLEDVRLLPDRRLPADACSPDGYYSTVAPCSASIEAQFDAGGRPLTLWAMVPGDKTRYGPLRPELIGGQVWYVFDGLPITTAGATTSVAVHWGTCTDPTNVKTCTGVGSSPTAQRAYLEDPGNPIPLAGVFVGDAGPGSSGANSFQIGSTPTLQLTVHVANSLKAAASTNPAADPVVMLRSASGSGSNTQAVDCDAAPTGFRDEVENGCQTPYQVNEEALCPNSDDPASCVFTQTGDFLGQLRQGLDARIGCPANNWLTDGPDHITLDDPRLVALLIVPPASFTTSGTHLVPIIKFAYFYVTGWDGVAPCPANDPYPGTGAPHGDVWGHWVQYTGYVPGGVPSDDPCDLVNGDPSACMVALIR